ncbi:MAG: helix-turn-helix domain-containing protein [bacterium]|nr:helix-turn-helix domain-containing protein [bacterium]
MQEQLKKLGFSEGEAGVYLAMLELGETSVARIAQKAKLERTTVYGFLDNLKKRGLISVSKRKKKTVYTAENPKKLKMEIEEKGKFLEAILPQLLSITNAVDKKPTVRYFDSQWGIYDIYRETLEYPGHTIRMWMSDRGMWYDDEKFWKDFYMPTRIEKKILLQTILPKSEASLDFSKDNVKFLREIKLTDDNSITADIMLYGTRSIAIISYDEMTALVVESDKLFQTLSGIFKTYWNSLAN